MKFLEAKKIAEIIVRELSPHCERIQIAGSIRRERPMVKDIEIVAIPKPYDVGLFASGIAPVVEQWKKVKGELPCKYTQRILPQGIKLDLFFATPQNWGLIFAIRTGSAEFSHKVLAGGWVRAGYRSVNGQLYNCLHDKVIGAPKIIQEETDLFKLIGLPYTEPQAREL